MAKPKVWKEWLAYWHLDRRSACLTMGLFLTSTITYSIISPSAYANQPAWPKWQSLWFGLIVLVAFVLLLALSFEFQKSPVERSLTKTLALFVAFAFALAFAFIFTTLALVVASAPALNHAVANNFFFDFIVRATLSSIITITVAVAITTQSSLIEKYQKRAEAARQVRVSSLKKWSELSGRTELWHLLQHLLLQRKNTTLGLAGRRGAGKTDFLQRLIEPIAIQGTIKRLRRMTMFVHSPADFDEMSFLSALYEQVALKVDEALAEMIPAVKPHPVMRELQAKAVHQRVLHRIYLLLYVLLLALIGLFIFTLSNRSVENTRASAFVQVATDSLPQDNSGIDRQLADSLHQQSRAKMDPLTAIALAKNNQIYQFFLDSLARQTQALRDSLRAIEKEWQELLNPPTSFFLQLPQWYESGNHFSLKREIKYYLLLDSLLKYPPAHQQELLDSLAQQFQRGQRRLDLIAVRGQEQQILTAILSEYDQRLGQLATSGRIPLQGLWLIFGGMVMLPGLMWILGREPGGSLHDAQYQQRLPNEIILYKRTQEVLARLRFHHSFGEEQSASFSGGGWGFSAGLGKSKQVTRAQVPFTLLSLVEEYRNYIREVCLYLNRALAEDKIEDTVKIYIAIDELDKVLDTERLHQMLKSIKAIFDLENVYYIISISEDALGTYRLRNVETKNEVDSAFTHILLVPPLDAVASIKFFHDERKVPPAFIAPLVVYGVGVPRDMHRLADIATIKTDNDSAHNAALKKWQNPSDCIHYFFNEDQQALGDLISQQPGLSDIWKLKFLSQIQQDDLAIEAATQDNLDRLAEIDLEKFIKSNPGSADENRKLFFRLRGLVSGYFVKNHLHRQLLEFQALWQQHAKEDFAAEKLPQEIVDWLEAWREVAYEISSNPLGAWERLKQLDQQDK